LIGLRRVGDESPCPAQQRIILDAGPMVGRGLVSVTIHLWNRTSSVKPNDGAARPPLIAQSAARATRFASHWRPIADRPCFAALAAAQGFRRRSGDHRMDQSAWMR